MICLFVVLTNEKDLKFFNRLINCFGTTTLIHSACSKAIYLHEEVESPFTNL